MSKSNLKDSFAHPLFLAGISILLWGVFATLALKLKHLPPFLTVALALGIGGALSLPKFKEWFQKPKILLLGIFGIFGYHFCLFMALRHAPAMEANLINYLWPIFIVLFSSMLPGAKLNRNHILGGLLAFIGAGLVITQGKTDFDFSYGFGYACALGAALIWGIYSVLTKKWGGFPTSMVGGFCFFSAILSLIAHFIFEPVTEVSFSDMGIVALIGLGPMGIAFYTWDMSIKRGDPRIIGALSYFTPFLSTCFLALASGVFPWTIGVSLVLIVLGSIISSR